jgi:SAM-dependent methyltransferase
MIENAKELTECLACGSSELQLVLDLHKQPLANSFISSAYDEEEVFPLKLNICTNCTHLQLSHAVNPDLLFKNYLYVSGTSKTLKEYFDWFAKYATEFSNNHGYQAKTVLDIACNDGTQLDSFKAVGLDTYGVDPAENLHQISNKNHTVICDYFTQEHVSFLSDKKIDIINAQNVFAHNSYPLDFLKMCKQIMHNNSLLFIQTSQADMVENNEFDTIYHEHLSFFNSNSMRSLAERADLNLVEIIKTPIHGNSYVFVFTNNDMTPNQSVANMLKEEFDLGLQNLDTYTEYSKKAEQAVRDLKETLDDYCSDYVLIGYGAAAKGNTLLNFGKIELDFIIDDNPLKQGLFTPGTHIPVVGIDILEEVHDKKVVFVPLAWNFFTEIRGKIKAVRNNDDDIFIRYFPTLSIEK